MLTLLSELGKIDGKRLWGLYQCSCGNTKKIRMYTVIKGLTKSCGCLASKKTHGLSRSETMNTWESMISRCSRKTSPSYKNYGGKGIKFCRRWSKFSNFLEDMGVRPKGTSLDRIDSLKNYNQDNCRWSLRGVQNHNKTPAKGRKYKGVFNQKTGVNYYAKIRCEGKVHYLGTFTTKLDAAIAYDAKAIELFGENASLNLKD